MVSDVFLSYGPDDRKAAIAIARYLQAKGLRVFFDQDALVAGQDFESSIGDAISNAQVVVVLLSSRSKRSTWVQKDLAQALETKQLVVPVLLDEGAKENWVWPLLSRWQALDLGTDQNRWNEGLQQLASIVSKAVTGPGEPKRVGPMPRALGSLALLAVVVALLVAFGVFFVLRSPTRDPGVGSTELVALFSRTAEAAMTSPSQPTLEPTAPVSDEVTILSPASGDRVAPLEILRGTVSNRSTDIWVVIHPLNTAAYWVQPKVTEIGGTWSSLAFFGRSSRIDAGKGFEIRAVVSPRGALREGDILPAWPDAASVSRPVRVVRAD